MKKSLTILFAMIGIAALAQYNPYKPDYTGFTTAPIDTARYLYDTTNQQCQMFVTMKTNGTASTGTYTTISLPVNAAEGFTQKDVITAFGPGLNTCSRIITRPGSNTADLCYNNGGIGAWATSGAKSVTFVFNYETQPFRQHIFFDGNSIYRHNSLSGVAYGVYDSLITYHQITLQNYAVPGRTTPQITAEFGSKIAPWADSLDIVVVTEVTNDIAGGATATQAYNHIVEYVDTARSKVHGIQVYVMTTLPRNDNTSYWAKIDSTNNMIRADTSGKFRVLNINSLSRFDARTDADNTTYFQSDKLHPTAAGEALEIGYIFPEINNHATFKH